jgi:hippurate hydrolase
VTETGRLVRDAEKLLPELIALRRQIHRQPEVGLDLPETKRAVTEALEGLDLEVRTGGRTSAVVATLRGARPGPTLLLRADMDALPLTEETTLPFASEVEGAMHACGHDSHVAMLVGGIRLLSERREEIRGTVKALFQPGEEGYGGARILIEEGLLDGDPRVDVAFAIHANPALPGGQIATRPGPLLASGDILSIDLKGRGGHASMPHNARDPIPAACEIVQALQTLVTRRVDVFDPAVVSVSRIQAGTAANVIPETAHLLGTIRTVSEATRRRVHEGIRRVAEGVASAHGLEIAVHTVKGYPVTENHPDFTSFVEETSRQLLGDRNLVRMPSPIMGAEDFSYVLQQRPGAMVFLGMRPNGIEMPAALHSNRMMIGEDAMATGAALHAMMALRYLDGTERSFA